MSMDTGFEESGSPFQKQLLELALNPRGLVKRRWFWMVLAGLVGLAATAVVVATVVPRFEATASVLVTSQVIPEDLVRSTVGGLDSLANVNTLVGEVLSQRNMSSLVNKLGLHPELEGSVSHADVVNLVRSHVTITPQRNVNQENPRESSSIFVISYEGDTPQAAADVCNEVASILIAAGIDKRVEQARRTTDFLRHQLVKAEEELKEVNGELASFNTAHRGELPGDLEPALQKLERLEQQRQTLSERISAAEGHLVSLQNTTTASPTQKMLAQLEQELSGELVIHTDDHPNVIALRQRIARIRSDSGGGAVARGGNRSGRSIQIAATRREISTLRERLFETGEELRELDARVDRIPRRTEEFNSVDRRAAVLRETYLDFLRKVQDAELAQTLESAQQGTQVTLLDEAQPPSGPTLSRLLFLLPGLVGSLALAALIGIVLELIDPVILSPKHFESVGSPELLGSIYKLG